MARSSGRRAVGKPLTVFLSWSGDRSRFVAEGLRSWLPLVIDVPQAWLSSADIPEGSRWASTLADVLGDTDFGIVIVTPENVAAPWLLFEAGALSKHATSSRVIPYLVDMSPDELTGPLAQFQSVTADKAGTLRLVRAIAETSTVVVSPAVVARRAETFWPELDAKLRESAGMRHDKPQNSTRRSLEDLKAQISELSQILSRATGTAPPSNASVTTGQTASSKSIDGAWFEDTTSSWMYICRIGDRRIAPFCFAGDDELTGVFLGWSELGDGFWSDWHWLNRSELHGIALFTHTQDDILVTTWWMGNDSSSEVRSLPRRGLPALWRRRTAKIMPSWAATFIEQAVADHRSANA
jgi:hypothetical protein